MNKRVRTSEAGVCQCFCCGDWHKSVKGKRSVKKATRRKERRHALDNEREDVL